MKNLPQYWLGIKMLNLNEVKKGFSRRLEVCKTAEEVRKIEREMGVFYDDDEITELTLEARNRLKSDISKRMGGREFHFERGNEYSPKRAAKS